MKQYILKDLYKHCIEKGYISKDIEYKEFADITRDFNKQVSERILNNQYRFNFGLGLISVIRDDRRGQSIDWHTSKKVKQDIIDRGEVPYSKLEAPDGVKWLVYFEGKDYFKWSWFKDTSVKFIKNASNYIFKPMTGNRKKIGKVIKNNPFADLDYGIHK